VIINTTLAEDEWTTVFRMRFTNLICIIYINVVELLSFARDYNIPRSWSCRTMGQYIYIYKYILYTRLRYLCLSLSFLFGEKCHIEIHRRLYYHHSSKAFDRDIKIFRGHTRIPSAGGIIVILYSRSMYIYYIIIYVSEMLIKKNKNKNNNAPYKTERFLEFISRNRTTNGIIPPV